MPERLILDGWEITKGITDSQIDELVWLTRTDSEIAKFTSDSTRFKDSEAVKNWLPGRTTFVLSDISGKMMGLVWFSDGNLPEDSEYTEYFDRSKYKKTFAIRLYEGARGKKLGLPFMQNCFLQYMNDNSENKKVWLAVSDANIAAKKLYQKFGFRQVSSISDKGKILMIFDGV